MPAAAARKGLSGQLVRFLINGLVATAVQQVRAVGLAAPVCLGVHPIFAGDALAVLSASGPARIASCNSIPHPSNQIDLGPLLAEALPALCQT